MNIRDIAIVATSPRTLMLRIRRFAATMPWLEAGLAGLAGFITIYLLAEVSSAMSVSLLIAPFGASCVLVFALPRSPLANPRNVIGGHVISAAIGLAVLTLIGASAIA